MKYLLITLDYRTHEFMVFWEEKSHFLHLMNNERFEVCAELEFFFPFERGY